MARIAVIEGREVHLKAGSLSIQKTANDRSTLSGTVHSLASPVSLGDRIGLVKDIAPGARAFNGTSSVLSRAFSSGTTNNWTIGVWAKPTTAAAQRFALCVGTASNGYGLFHSADGYWRGAISGVDVFGGTSAPVTTGAWVLLVARRSSGNSQLFVDGQPLGSTIAGAPTAPNGYISVGCRRDAGNTAFQQFFDGELAHAFIAHSALTDAQIATIATGGPGGMGLAPDRVITSGTYWYYPIRGLASPEPDSAASSSLTVTNAPATTDGPLVLSSSGIALFSGEIDQAPVSGLDGQPLEDTEVRISARDHLDLVARRLVSGQRSSETLKARLTWLVSTYLAVYGVTLDASHDNGPTVAARAYDDVPMETVIADLSKECADLGDPRLLDIDELLVLRMPQPSSIAAPFDLDEDDVDSPLVGDLKVEPSRLGGYANRVVGLYGTPGQQVQRTDTFTGDGSTNAFVLTYTPVSFRGLVTYNGVEQPLGTGGAWTHDSGTNAIARAAGAPANASSITIVYTSNLPIRVVSTDGSHSSNPVEVKIEDTSIADLPAAQAKNDAELSARLSLATQVTVKYSTHTDGLKIGQSQHIDYATTRDVDDDFVIIEQRITDVLDGESFQYDITAVNGTNFQTWRQKSRGSSGSSAPLTGVGAFIVPGGFNDARGNVVAQRDTSREVVLGKVIPVPGTLEGGGVAFPLVTGALGGDARWFIYQTDSVYGSGRQELRFFDLQQNGVPTYAACAIRWNPLTSAYEFGMQSGVPLQIGDDSIGRRVIVNATVVRAQTAYYERGRSVPMGEWASYSPTWGVTSGSAPAIGNGSLSGAYTLIGKTVHWRIVLTAGSTTTFGSGGAWTFTLPETALSLSTSVPMATAVAFDASVPTFAHGYAMWSTTTTVLPRLGAALAVITATAPWTWAVGDTLVFRGTYEIA